jgi:mitochondrial inner membrane protease subunit 2
MSARSFWRPGKGQTRAAVYSFLGLVSWFPVIASFNLYVAEVTRINGKSMYPFMNADRDSTLRRDVCLNWKWGANKNLERGMVVTLRYVVISHDDTARSY